MKNSILILLLGILCSCNTGKQMFKERRNITPYAASNNNQYEPNNLNCDNPSSEREYIIIEDSELQFEMEFKIEEENNISSLTSKSELTPKTVFKGSRPTRKLRHKKTDKNQMNYSVQKTEFDILDFFLQILAVICLIWFFMWLLDL